MAHSKIVQAPKLSVCSFTNHHTDHGRWTLLIFTPQGRYGKGRPRSRWIDVVAKYLIAIDQNVAYESTYNRERWGDLLKAAMVLNGPVS
ncbi:hypothetical protein ACI65C_007657 [Semiaphis heraclei]